MYQIISGHAAVSPRARIKNFFFTGRRGAGNRVNSKSDASALVTRPPFLNNLAVTGGGRSAELAERPKTPDKSCSRYHPRAAPGSSVKKWHS